LDKKIAYLTRKMLVRIDAVYMVMHLGSINGVKVVVFWPWPWLHELHYTTSAY